jgi:hypothetical protein
MTSAYESSDLDMALPRKDAQSGLRTEVDELPSKVTLVLWYVLVQRRWQTRIIPCSSLRVVVDKVHSRSVSEAHFPTARERSQLRHGLLLDSGVISTSVLPTVHPNVLLPSRVDPCGCASVMVNKVCATLRGVSLLPACWKLAGTCGGRTCSHHLGGGSLVHRFWRLGR